MLDRLQSMEWGEVGVERGPGTFWSLGGESRPLVQARPNRCPASRLH